MPSLVSFEERQRTETEGKPLVEGYLKSLSAGGVLREATAHEQQSLDIDYVWAPVGKPEVSVEMKVDSQAHRTGNFAFETISNEVRCVQGCFMRSKADYLFYLLLGNKTLYVMKISDVRQWFVSVMERNQQPFRQFRCNTPIEGGRLIHSQGYLVPIQVVKSQGLIVSEVVLG